MEGIIRMWHPLQIDLFISRDMRIFFLETILATLLLSLCDRGMLSLSMRTDVLRRKRALAS
jgi:hypothetical protein